ncbi:MAG: hypothetical protein IPF52_11030 [Saprospiraceae bacterium]|nr:hypothetical protein [Saprospiraceae bacterium]
MNNIKTRFQILNNGNEKPLMSIYDHEQLMATLHETELKIGSKIPTNNGDYHIVNIILMKYKEDVPNYDFGIEIALVGERLPYNFEIRVYLEKI